MYVERLHGKRLLITGGSSGIGRAVVEEALACGAKVGVIGNKPAEFATLPKGVLALTCDVRSATEVNTAVDAFVSQMGGIDGVVNAAGVSLWKPLLEMDDDFWNLIYDVNVKGTFHVCQATTRHFIPRKDGIILNIASMSAVKSGTMYASAYASSKWAVVGLSRNLHLELKPHGVRVACYCPGSTQTALHVSAGSTNQDAMLLPKEVAETICFMLAASERGHIQLCCQPAMFEEWR
jgi:NAD(P)-dependent dehydrogenase (short-subunit alcohol dehydrogenase family)